MKKHPKITTVAMADKNEAYSFRLVADVKGYTIKMRGNHEFKIAYESGVLGTTGTEAAEKSYMTIPAGSAESEDNLNREDPIIIYFQAEVDNETAEIKFWR